jgi:hypothetical protein
MATAVSIDPASIYDDVLLCELLGVGAQTCHGHCAQQPQGSPRSS